MPSTDLDVMKVTLAAWPVALAIMQSGGEPPANSDVARLFDSLTRWRRHRTVWIPVGPR